LEEFQIGKQSEVKVITKPTDSKSDIDNDTRKKHVFSISNLKILTKNASPIDKENGIFIYMSVFTERNKLEWIAALSDAVSSISGNSPTTEIVQASKSSFKKVHQPDLWPKPIIPSGELNICFSDSSKVQHGNTFLPSQVSKAPKISFESEKNFFYSLIMINLDHLPNSSKDTHLSGAEVATYLQWGIVNIKGNDYSTGKEVNIFFYRIY
jgi:hypothetical protein